MRGADGRFDLKEPVPPLLPEDVAVMEAVCNSPARRAAYAETMSAVRRDRFAAIAEAPSDEAARRAGQLATEGVTDLGVLVGAAQVADMLAYLRPRPVYGAHIATKSDGVGHDLEDFRTTAHYGAYAPEDVARCPHLVEIANDPRLLQIAEAYLGCPPTLYNLNVWWSFARGSQAREAQSLHRDADDVRFVTLFIYLTTVTADSGPHLFIKYSHDEAAMAGALAAFGAPPDAAAAIMHTFFQSNATAYVMGGDTAGVVAPLAMRWEGPAGSAIMADTYGVHMGVPVRTGDRLMAWARYGVGHGTVCFNGGYGDIFRPRIPATDRARYINRLLLRD